MVAKVERCKNVCEEHHQLEVELQKRHHEVIQLQEAVSDLQVHLYQEREQVLRLYAENDRLKIRALQDRKKINYLLSMTSTSEKELNLICTRPWRTVVLQKGTSAFPNNSSSAKLSASSASEKQTNAGDIDALILQNKALSTQLEEQTRLFQDNYHTLLKDRELLREEASTQFEQCQEKISSLTSKLNEARTKLCDTVKEMLLIKEENLRNELTWTTERDMFLKTIQKQDSGVSSFDHSIKGDGRSKRGDRITCELRLLKDELSQREQVISMYQEQCNLLEEKGSTLQKHLEVHKAQCKDKIQKLQQLVTVLKGKYNQLDQRRRLESEGFRSDVRILRNRLQEIERTLLKFTRSTSLSSLKLDHNVFMAAADTVSKAKLLGQEIQLIQKKVAEMDSKLNS
ncbi:hypothetical protein R5R35_012328 [Gryllus longicercus]|uniref:Coiled-coil domain-containing protein 77 n=1 Tax=Gryllus longicercus TaxID=2509291 RepID=A0AAN9VDW1_9ORTH